MIKTTGQRCGFCNPALLWCTVFLTQTFWAPFFLANVLAMRKALPWTCRKMVCVGSLPWGGSGGWVRYAYEDGRNTGGAVSDNKRNDRKQNCLCQTSSCSLFLCLCDVWKSFCATSLHWELQEVPHFFPGLGLQYGCLSVYFCELETGLCCGFQGLRDLIGFHSLWVDYLWWYQGVHYK